MKSTAVVSVMLMAMTSGVAAQGLRPVRAAKVHLGLDFVVAQPVGQFGNFVNAGLGAAGHVAWTPDPAGVWGIRADASYLIYGSQTRWYGYVPLVDVGVHTMNQIAGLQVGPQITLGKGDLQVYGFGQVGFSYFFTTSSADRGWNTTTNYDDVTLATAAGGGVRLQLSHGQHPISLDAGARYLHNGRTRYLTEGSIRVTDNAVYLSPIESQANMVVYQIGVAVGLR
jgi:hypothetical protein